MSQMENINAALTLEPVCVVLIPHLLSVIHVISWTFLANFLTSALLKTL